MNGDQEIEAPTHSRPLSKLTDSLGGALEGLGAGRRDAAATTRDRRGCPTARPSTDERSGGRRRVPAATRSASTRRAPRTPRAPALRRPAAGARRPTRPPAPCAGRAAGRCPSARRSARTRAPAPSGRALVALVVRRRALEQHRAAVVADRADRVDLLGAQRRHRRARRPAPRACARSAWRLPASSISVGATHSTAGWARFHAQASCSGVSEWRSANGRSRSSFSRPASTQPVGPEAAVVAARELVSRQHVVVEQAAVVHDARDHPHAVALRRRQRQLAGPGLERTEDQHRPVDQLAVALEAADHVEREPVGRARARCPIDAGQPLVAQRGAGPPTPRATRSRAGRGCAAAARRRRRRRGARRLRSAAMRR